MSDSVRINGYVYSWGSIVVKVNNERYHGFRSISYGDSRERAFALGQGNDRAPRGITRGKYTTEPVVLGGHKDSVQALRDAFARADDGECFGNTMGQIIVQYEEPALGLITDELEDVYWSKNTASHEEGPDPLTEDIELMCKSIRWGGKTLYTNGDGLR